MWEICTTCSRNMLLAQKKSLGLCRGSEKHLAEHMGDGKTCEARVVLASCLKSKEQGQQEFSHEDKGWVLTPLGKLVSASG